MATPLLTTKLYIPPVRPELVSRPRLIEQLNEGLHRKLILISAPAGFGKTTLVSAWLKESGIPVAWISLDTGDNDPARFLAYLIAALRRVEADIGKGALGALQSPKPPVAEGLLTGLINQISALPHDLILVLDDYHLITARPVHEALSFLLEHLPPRMHLAIATRADPPLPIARLRGRGQLTELRQTDLRFSLEEATAFLNQVMGLDLSASDITALTSRTEGWITGLQMAALALQPVVARQAAVATQRQYARQVANVIEAFTGSNRYVLDYLVEEVLQRQPENIQDFLLQTAILDRLTGPLCDTVLALEEPVLDGQTPISSVPSPSQQILERLEEANLFIVPLDNERRWYRYHRLFADLLRKRVQQVQPEQVPILHRRASAWYEQNGLTGEAIKHTLATKDYERAADLIEQTAEAMLRRSEVATLQNWIDTLPDELVRARPYLCFFHAWALLWSGQPLESIESRLRDIEHDAETISSQMTTLHAFVATWQGRFSRAGDLAREALERLPEEESFLRGIAAWNLGISYLLRGDLEAGSEIIDQVARMGQKEGNLMIAVNALCHLAELQMSGAQLHEAKNLYQQALELARDAEGRPLPISGMALIGLGELSREWNDLEAAARDLTEGIERLQQWGEFAALDGYIALARVKQAQGDREGARNVMQDAKEIALQFDVSELDDLAVAMYQTRLWIAQGNLEAAMCWIEEQGFSANHVLSSSTETGPPGSTRSDTYLDDQMRHYLGLLMARVLVAQDSPAEALPLLESQIAMLEQRERHRSRRMLESRIITALALQAQGKIEQALASLEEALSVAEPEGYVRMFVDEGEPMLRLLREAASRGIAPEYVSRLVVAFDLPAYGDASAAFPRTHPHSPAQPLVEPLSERELEVLRLLSTGLSNPEIAQELYIATSTVRSHLKNIYSKLNVHKRWDAVHRAEELGLV